MQKKAGERRKRVPLRVCISCREAAGKRGLIRVVRISNDSEHNKNGSKSVEIDLSGKMPGRGAYLHPRSECWRIALETNRIGQSLRTKVSAECTQKLEAFAATLDDSVLDDSIEEDETIELIKSSSIK